MNFKRGLMVTEIEQDTFAIAFASWMTKNYQYVGKNSYIPIVEAFKNPSEQKHFALHNCLTEFKSQFIPALPDPQFTEKPLSDDQCIRMFLEEKILIHGLMAINDL